MKIHAKINKLYILFVLLFSLTSVTSFADSANNGTCALAETLTTAGTTGLADRNEEDWYVFTAGAAGTVSINFVGTKKMDLYFSVESCATDQYLDASTAIFNNAGSPVSMNSGETFIIRVISTQLGASYTLDLTYNLTPPDFTASNFRPYTKININGETNTNINGDMTIIGNSQLECTKYESGGSWINCTDGAAPAGIPNNDINTRYSNYDGDGSTFNSTSADILETGITPVPADAAVLWAGLYWQGRMDQTSSDTVKASGSTVKLKVPGGTYVDVVADTYNWINTSSTRFDFQGFTDITSIVSSSPHGTYWVADIQADDGDDGTRDNRYGAWSVVVVYESPAKPLKNISVYDGYLSLYGTENNANGVYDSVDVSLTGFLTPTSGDVDSTFFIFAGEGDDAFKDGVSMDDNESNAQPVVSSNNNDGNQINSTETSYGTNVTSRTPAHVNTIGIDIDAFNVGTVGTGHLDIITNTQTSTVIHLVGDDDRYFPAVFAFSTELYQPDLCYFEEVFDISGNSLQDGAEVTYGDDVNVKVYLLNQDNEIAEQVHIWRTFDANLPYHADTTSVDNLYDSSVNTIPTFIAVTDVNDTVTNLSDLFYFDIAGVSGTELTGQFQINLGTGADGLTGGDFDPGQESMMEYNATVNTEENTTISYNISYLNPITGDLYNGQLTNKCSDFNNSFWGRGATVVSPTGGMDTVDVFTTTTYNGGSVLDDGDGPGPDLVTRISGEPATLEIVYLDDGSTPPPVPFYAPGAIRMPIYLYYAEYNSSTGVYDEIGPVMNNAGTGIMVTYMEPVAATATTEPFTMGLTRASATVTALALKARRNVKILMKYIDFNADPNQSTDSCVISSATDGNIQDIPQCLNAETKLRNVFKETGDKCLTLWVALNAKDPLDPKDSEKYGPCTSNAGGPQTPYYPPYDIEPACYACLIDGQNDALSVDAFSIRPKDFILNTNVVQSDDATIVLDQSIAPATGPNKMRAGEDYNASVAARDYVNANALGYDQASNQLNPATTHLLSTLAVDTANLSADVNVTFGGAVTYFVDGVNPNYVIKYDEVGIVDVDLNDTDWAAIDSDDTPSADYTHFSQVSPATRYGRAINGPLRLTIKPYDFNITAANLFDNNDGSGFTYLSDDMNMSARLPITIQAQNKSGGVTANYSDSTQGLYEQLANFTLAVDNSAYPALLTLVPFLPTNADLPFINGVAVVGEDDENVTKFNFDRATNVPVNPFQIDGSDVNLSITDTDLVSGDGNGSFLGNAKFVYGRAHMARTRAMCNSGSCNGNMTFYFEFYGDKDANKTLINTLLGTPLRSIDSVNWYQNTAHNTNTGDGNVTTSTTNIPTSTITYTPNGGSTSTALYNYSGSKGYPYKGSINVTSGTGTQSWLIYDKYSATATAVRGELEYYGPGKWSSTTTDGAETTVDDAKSNKQKNTNRRIRW